ncbi:LysE family transporter [Roseobacter sp. EG26]|uniref:LysE family transporter n=1 Tax=Roseobacter sp. EG26 TaxID=3412477 RepID=UPI003CE48E59
MEILPLLPPILLAALIASASPGPATLAIAATSMSRGAGAGLRLAAGVLTGSLIWSSAAAAGLAALMLRHGWAVEVIRYAGAAYLFWLAFKSLRAAWRGGLSEGVAPARHAFRRGLLLHLTNPKAIFFFGALYAVILSPGQSPAALGLIVGAVGLQSAVVFLGYALLFSRPGPMRLYRRGARGINALAGLAFAGLGLRLLTSRLA